MSNIVELTDFKCEAAIPGLFATAGSVAPNNIVIQNKVIEFCQAQFPNYTFRQF